MTKHQQCDSNRLVRIGIDIRALQWEHRYRGIGVYLINLLEALAQIDRRNQYFLYGWGDSDPLHELRLASDFKYKFIGLNKPTSKIIGQKLKNILKRDIKVRPGSIDVFLQPDIAFGFADGRTANVAVVYDLIEMLFKQESYPNSFLKLFRSHGLRYMLGNKMRWRLYKWQLGQLRKAYALITISEATKKDLLKLFPDLSPSKIRVTPLASSVQIEPTPRNDTGSTPSILYIGAVDYRKNIVGLVKAFEAVKKDVPRLKLILAGKDFGEKDVLEHKQIWQAINNSAHRNDIVIRGYVPRPELAKLYKTASVFVFPSLYEGFGMPILEAMASGCPVVAYNSSSIPEVAGNAALLVELGENLSIPLKRILLDKTLRVELSRRGLEQAKKFSWLDTAESTLKILEEAAQQ